MTISCIKNIYQTLSPVLNAAIHTDCGISLDVCEAFIFWDQAWFVFTCVFTYAFGSHGLVENVHQYWIYSYMVFYFRHTSRFCSRKIFLYLLGCGSNCATKSLNIPTEILKSFHNTASTPGLSLEILPAAALWEFDKPRISVSLFFLFKNIRTRSSSLAGDLLRCVQCVQIH